MEMIKAKALFIQGIPYWGGGPGKSQGDDNSSYGHLAAIDPRLVKQNGAIRMSIRLGRHPGYSRWFGLHWQSVRLRDGL